MKSVPSRILAAALAALMTVVLTACMSMRASSVSIAEAQAAADETLVVVEANIIQDLGSERYLVRDASGQIIAEIDEDIIGEVQVAPDTTLRLFGEIDRNDSRSVLQVEKIQIID